jgi:hypothetical protein
MIEMLAFKVLTTDIDVPDGEYTLAVDSLDYKDTDPTNDTFKHYFAQRKVEVKGGHVRLYDLISGCYDLHDQTGYWGAYIESLEYNAEAKAIFVDFGS